MLSAPKFLLCERVLWSVFERHGGRRDTRLWRGRRAAFFYRAGKTGFTSSNNVVPAVRKMASSGLELLSALNFI